MTSFLSEYRNFINVLTKEGLTLLSNATDKSDCPLKDDERISLCSGGSFTSLLSTVWLSTSVEQRCSQLYCHAYNSSSSG
jgi:hypothetical protein